MSSIGGHILRICNARRSTAASYATRVHKHQAGVYGHDRQSHLAILEGPGAYSPLRGPIWRIRHARQSAAAPRSAHVVTHQTNITPHGELVKTRNLRGADVTSPHRGPIWRNTQCEAVRERIPLGSRRHARNNHHSPRWAYQNSESSMSSPGMSVLAESRSANDDTSPTNCHGFW
jgi:hypothetical protein